MENRFENAKFGINYFPTESIVEFYMKAEEIDVNDVKEMHAVCLAMTKGNKYANIFSAEDFFSITGEARAEGSKPVYSEYLIAQALVVKNMAQRLLGNFVMRVNKPVRPTKMFANKEDARVWVLAKIREFEKKQEKSDLLCV